MKPWLVIFKNMGFDYDSLPSNQNVEGKGDCHVSISKTRCVSINQAKNKVQKEQQCSPNRVETIAQVHNRINNFTQIVFQKIKKKQHATFIPREEVFLFLTQTVALSLPSPPLVLERCAWTPPQCSGNVPAPPLHQLSFQCFGP